MTQTFHFEIVVKNTRMHTESEDLVNELYVAGLDDAVIGMGDPSVLAFDVTRESINFKSAVDSVCEQLKTVLPDLSVLEVGIIEDEEP